MISIRSASKTFRCSVFTVVWLHQLSIVHDCAGERRNSFPFGIRVISKLLCTIRDRHTVFIEAATRSAPISGVNCQVGLRVSSFVRLLSFSLTLHVLLFLCRYSLPTAKEEDLSTSLLALVESSNLPFPPLDDRISLSPSSHVYSDRVLSTRFNFNPCRTW